MKLTWLGTAAFRIEIGQSVIYTDPYISRPPKARPKLSLRVQDIDRADYLFLSHGHFDHVADVPQIARQTGARIFAHSRVCDALRERGVPDAQLRPVEGVKTIGLEDFRVRTIPSTHVHFDGKLVRQVLVRMGWRLLPEAIHNLRYPLGGVLGYLFTSPECSWCFFGSAGYDPNLIRGLAPDMALIPVQGRSDICHVAAEMAALMAPKWVIPHHHDDFYPPTFPTVDLAPFVSELGRLSHNSRVYIPQIEQTVQFERGELGPMEG